MRLRHKKPINSYVGQANLESSEVLDEDFDKNISAGKKPKLLKQKANSDHMRKYAEILVQFIQTINTDYNAHMKKFPAKNRGDPSQKSKDIQFEPIISKKAREEENARRKPQVVSKQQQKGKLQQKNKLLVGKEQRKQKTPKEDDLNKKEIKPILQTPKPQTKYFPTPKKNQIDLTLEDNELQQPKNQHPNNLNQMGQMMFQGANPYAMNSLYQSLQYSLPMYQQQFAQQLKQNPNYLMYMQPMQFQNILAMMSMQNMQQLPQNCIPFSKLPFNQNKKESQAKPVEPPKIEKVEIKPKLEMKSQAPNSMSNGFFNKRSCIHVAIAYHIHCEKLKASGKLNNTLNWKSSDHKHLDELDPTYPAKKVRERNHEQILHNPPQQTMPEK